MPHPRPHLDLRQYRKHFSVTLCRPLSVASVITVTLFTLALVGLLCPLYSAGYPILVFTSRTVEKHVRLLAQSLSFAVP